jgi:hypothetical protein
MELRDQVAELERQIKLMKEMDVPDEVPLHNLRVSQAISLFPNRDSEPRRSEEPGTRHGGFLQNTREFQTIDIKRMQSDQYVKGTRSLPLGSLCIGV